MSDRKVLGLLVAIACCTCAFEAHPETKQGGESERLLRAEFPDLKLSETRGVTTLEICFDLCDVFQWRGSTKATRMWDFVAAYEYERGVGKESEQFRKNGESVLIDAINRMAKHCQRGRTDVAASYECAWNGLAKHLAIRVGSASYDEGQRCFGWRDLSSTSRPVRSHCAPVKDSRK